MEIFDKWVKGIDDNEYDRCSKWYNELCNKNSVYHGIHFIIKYYKKSPSILIPKSLFGVYVIVEVLKEMKLYK